MRDYFCSSISCVALQMALRGVVFWTGDGLGLALALQLVVAGLRAEVARNLHLQMAARIVQATQPSLATHELVQV